MKEIIQNIPLIISLAAIPVFIQVTDHGTLVNIVIGMLLVGAGSLVSDFLKKKQKD